MKASNGKPSLLIFGLDGTLIDSAQDRISMNATRPHLANLVRLAPGEDDGNGAGCPCYKFVTIYFDRHGKLAYSCLPHAVLNERDI